MAVMADKYDLPPCNMCMIATDPTYQAYNVTISGIVLAIVGVFGIVGNAFVIFVYTRPSLRKQSTSVYLAALAMSDLCMVCTAMFLFALEAWRHHGPPVLALIYGGGAPFVFPLGAMFQTTSVYFCVAAAVDCFISVVLSSRAKRLLCTAKRAKITVFVLTVCCILYNIPHFFEVESIACYEPRFDIESIQVCPTEIRQNQLYYTVYYTYMYTIFMAVGPLLLLVAINVVVVIAVLRRPADDNEDSDTISLILVVFLFICCNSLSLLINFLELLLYEQLAHTIVYLVDASNFLVVCNCTANFFIYLAFGKTFRHTFIDAVKRWKSASVAVDAHDDTQSVGRISPLPLLSTKTRDHAVGGGEPVVFLWDRLNNTTSRRDSDALTCMFQTSSNDLIVLGNGFHHTAV